MPPSTWIAVAAAGALGAVARCALAAAVHARWPAAPLATAVVNVVGCLGFGVCWAIAHERWPAWATTAVLAGFFGAFTTFSTFAFDCHGLLAARRFGWFALDVAAQNGLGVLAMAGGLWLGNALRST
jgi:CrcB protein